MRVLVTGSAGPVGAQIASELARGGADIVRFDIVDHQDVLDFKQLRSTVDGCDAIVHCAVKGHPHETVQETLATNYIGTWNVVSAGRDAGVKKLLYLSSVNAFGIFRGERPPDYFPIDINHACYPRTAYGLSKKAGEDVCEALTADTDIATTCLRLPEVWNADTYSARLNNWRIAPESEWKPFWEYGAFIDLRDVATACSAALQSSVEGFRKLLACATDIATSGPSAVEWAARLHPEVPWQIRPTDPYASLLATTETQVALEWTPRYSWRGVTAK